MLGYSIFILQILFPGQGVFAKEDIHEGQYVIFYAGEVLTTEPPELDDDFCIEIAGPGRKVFWSVLICLVKLTPCVLG